MEKLQQANVVIVGIGGVGSWVAESLARSGVGALTLIDSDEICYSNTNRQIHAMSQTAGRPKVDVLAERLELINPTATIRPIRAFYCDETAEELIPKDAAYVVDAIDKKLAKIHLITHCKKLGIPVIVSGGAGGRVDPSQVQLSDLRDSHNDRLLAACRKQIRKNLPGMHLQHKKKFDIPCVYSAEPTRSPHPEAGAHHLPDSSNHAYGSISFLTGTFGFTIAAKIINDLTQN